MIRCLTASNVNQFLSSLGATSGEIQLSDVSKLASPTRPTCDDQQFGKAKYILSLFSNTRFYLEFYILVFCELQELNTRYILIFLKFDFAKTWYIYTIWLMISMIFYCMVRYIDHNENKACELLQSLDMYLLIILSNASHILGET